jgi:hypothetical protein
MSGTHKHTVPILTRGRGGRPAIFRCRRDSHRTHQSKSEHSCAAASIQHVFAVRLVVIRAPVVCELLADRAHYGRPNVQLVQVAFRKEEKCTT